MDKPELIEHAECELADWVKRCHTSGLSYENIFDIVVNDLPKLRIQADAERHLRKGKWNE